MSFILRTWACRNGDCRWQFEDGDSNPFCPKCGSTVHYVPGGGHIQHGATKHADQTLRRVASSFKLTNLKSAREGEATHPGIRQPESIPGAPPLNTGYGISIPRTMSPSASFAQMPREMKGTLPTGHAFKRGAGKGGIPTNVRYKTMRGDPR